MSHQVTEGYRLSPQQRHLWHLQQTVAQESNRYPFLTRATVKITGHLDAARLQAALDLLGRRHEILRTSLCQWEGLSVALQAVNEPRPWQLSQYDLRGEDDASQRRWVMRWQEKWESEGAETCDWLSRNALVCTGEQEYLLCVCMHGMIMDAEGMRLFVRELGEAYGAGPDGEADPEQTLQYIAVSDWLNELLEADEAKDGKDYWARQGTSMLEALRLPAEKPDAEPNRFTSAFISRTLPQHYFSALGDSTSESTPELFLLGCWHLLLYRLTGQSPLPVATAFDGRRFEELQRAPGLFTKFLPVQSESAPGLPFGALLDQLRQGLAQAREWQEFYDWQARPVADDHSSEVVSGPLSLPFAFEYLEGGRRHHAAGIEFALLDLRSSVDSHRLKLSCVGGPEGVELRLHYDEGSLSGAAVERLAEEFLTVVEDALKGPGKAVGEVEVVGPEERELLVTRLNATGADYSKRARLLHELFEEQVERSPDAVALACGGRRLTYSELDRLSNRVARRLRRSGVGRESLVGVYLRRSPEMVVALLGALKAGAGYVPLEPGAPRQRLQAMMAESGVKVILTRAEELEEGLAEEWGGAELIEVDGEEVRGESEEGVEGVEVTGENVAYVIYTSGSTGRPKGVMISHEAISNRLLWMQEEYGLGEGDRVLQKTPYTFDASVWEFFIPLMTGARLVMAEPGGHQDSAYLVRTIREQGITVLQLVPSMLQVLLQEQDIADCHSLRRLFCGGEALSAELKERFYSLSNASLHNLYGPTECSIDATFWNCRPGGGESIIPIGRPLSNVQVYLLDERGSLMPFGAPGELHVGGAGLARGYGNRPDLTAERFVPNPFGAEPGSRLYKTGDLARYREDGGIEFLGRLDHQVKIRGFRIELGEIEFVLRQHAGVREAVVVAHGEGPDQKRLVAYVVPEKEQLSRPAGAQLYRLPNSLEVAHLNKNETDVIYKEVFEDECYLQHGVTLDDGACVFDVGANIGLFTVFANRRCRNARVYAFEPIPPTFEVLNTNAALYGPNTKVFNCGLSDSTRTADFTFYPKSSAMSGIYADTAEDEKVVRAFLSNQDERLTEYADDLLEGRFEKQTYRCQLRTVSEVMRENRVERIDLLKIDVEKSELDVLNGIEDEDWRKIKQVVIEVHEIDGRLSRITDALRGRGYHVAVEQDLLFGETGLYTVYAVHPSKAEAAPSDVRTGLSRHETATGGGQPLSSDELREYAGGRLPDYMLPSAFVFLPSLPLTHNGKLDRRALPAPDAAPGRTSPLRSPRTPIEELLCNVWAHLLSLPRVGIDDDFFALGGHSLLATRVISRLRRLCGVELPLRRLFEHPTVAGLAPYVERAGRDGAGALDGPPLMPVGREEARLPLSFGQQRLWFLQEMERASAAYNLPGAVRMEGELDVEALGRALAEVVRRHEVLRTGYEVEGGEPVQRVWEWREVRLEVEEVSGGSGEERERRARELAEEEAGRAFELRGGEVMRARVLRLGEREHVLLLNIHHIAFDGWSMGVLIQELVTLYAAFKHNQPSPLPELPIQYADFAIWQRRWLESEGMTDQLSYWMDKFKTAAPVLQLATDRPRPAVQTYRGAFRSVVLPLELSAALKELSRQEEATLFMTLLSAFKTLLYRYTGQTTLTVGTPIANRIRPELEGLIGLFANTLVLRTEFSGDWTFRDLLRKVREEALGAYANQDLPFEKLVEELHPQRDLSRNPLFQVMFVLQNAPNTVLELEDLRLSALEFDSGTAQFDLTFQLVEGKSGLRVMANYNTDMFDEETVTRMLGHYETLLQGIVSNPAEPIARLPLLPADEQQLLRGWNQTQRAYPARRLLHESFEEQAARTPEAVALVCAAEQLSYAELDRRANQVAQLLRRRGVAAESLVGIYLRRSAEMVVALLGTLKAGAGYVPLEPGTPAERLRLMAAEAGLRVILTRGAEEEEAAAVQWPGVELITLDSEEVRGESEAAVGAEVSGENVAYVIYTSGSTGRPKGVMVSHEAISNRLLWMQEEYCLCEDDRVLQKTPYTFDVSVWEFFWPLMTGARLVMAEPGGHQDSAYLVRTIREQGITTLHFVPSMLQVFLDEPKLEACTSLRRVICSGEALPAELQKRFFERMDVPLHNLYGPTEASVDVTFYRCDPRSRQASVPIGRPIANTQIYLLDARLRQVPVGVPGELHIGGIGLARGYVERPALTAAKFIPDPFSAEPGARLYKTGDLTRYLPDGNIEFLGRLDHQVKIRGFRIELQEVEAALDQHAAVHECVVTALPDASGAQSLVAYLVPARQHELDVKEVRGFLKDKLPEYMVPSVFVLMEHLPLTTSGKVDRKALPAPDGARPDAAGTLVRAGNTLELQLVMLWENILGLSPISVTDNFFDLGGHSLMAVRLMSQIHKLFGKELPLSTLFREPTIRGLAELIRQESGTEPLSPLVPIQPHGSKRPFFAVHPAGGQVLTYAPLSRHLGPDQPFYGLQAPYFDDEQQTYARLGELAAAYVEAIRLVQPEGPYLLGGFSFGGVVAFEMARQLRARGEDVALLALLDTPSPVFVRNYQKDNGNEEIDFAITLAILTREEGRRFGKSLSVNADELRRLDADGQLNYVLELLRELNPLVELPQIRRSLRAFKASKELLQQYEPETYTGRVTLFKASEVNTEDLLDLRQTMDVNFRDYDSALGWGAHTTEPVEIHVVPGDHVTIGVEPNVRVLADKLRLSIERAQGTDSTTELRHSLDATWDSWDSVAHSLK
jgi:amino acid adenylation domain-containing protein/FkbM family methyltransferase